MNVGMLTLQIVSSCVPRLKTQWCVPVNAHFAYCGQTSELLTGWLSQGLFLWLVVLLD